VVWQQGCRFTHSAHKKHTKLGNGAHRPDELSLTLEQRLQDPAIAQLAPVLGLDLLDILLDAQLGVGPQRLDGVAVGLADADEAALGRPLAGALDAELGPDGIDGVDEVLAQLLGVARRGGDAKTLLADWDGGVVDALDVDLVLLQQHVGSLLGNLGVAYQDRDDVARVRDDGDVALFEGSLDGTGVQLLQLPVAVVVHLVLDSGLGASHSGWGEGGGEDEARGEGPDHVNELGAAGNVAADAAVGLAEGTSDNVDAVLDGAPGAALLVGLKVEVLGNTGAVGAVHTDGVDFVQKGDGAVLVGEIANGLDGADGAAHAVDGLEGDDLGDVQREGSQLGLEVLDIIVLEDNLLCARMADALDHGGVVQAVGEDDAVRQLAAEGGKGGIVGHVAGAEDEGGLLGVELGNGALEFHRMLVVARDVPGTTGAGAVLVEGLVHPAQDVGVAAHAEIVVGAPDGDALVLVGHVGAGELLGQAVDVVEVAVGLVLVLLVELGIVVGLVVELCVGVDGVDSRGGSGVTGSSMMRDMSTITAGDHGGLDGAGLVGAAAVEAALGGAGGVSVSVATGVVGGNGAGGQASNAAGVGEAGDVCGLDGEGLAHDGAAVGQALQTGHCASAGRGHGLGSRTGRGGKSTERGGGCLLHEGAHGLGLPENSVHVRGVCCWAVVGVVLQSLSACVCVCVCV
jgi:hypothetical protein